MANPTKTTLSSVGVSVVKAAAAVTHATTDVIAARADATYVLTVINAGASPTTVTIDDPNSVGPDGATAFNPDATMTVAAGVTRQLWIRDPRRFINASTGNIGLAYSNITTVTHEVTELL